MDLEIKTKSIEIPDGIKKAATKNYVIYDRDWLLDHLAQEIYLLEFNRRWKAEHHKDFTIEDIKKGIEPDGEKEE
jgi:hypothetical protein